MTVEESDDQRLRTDGCIHPQGPDSDTPRNEASSKPDRSPAWVQAADPSTTHAISSVIADALNGLEVAAWLVADPGDRARAIYAVVHIHVDAAVRYGRVLTTGPANTAVAVWRRSAFAPLIPDYNRRLALATGPYLNRFLFLRRALAGPQPRVPHEHLEFLATVPLRRRAGYASRLLAHHSVHRAGLPSHATAPNDPARQLLLRYGYIDDGEPVDLPDGPRLWPMTWPAATA
jgi:hypothetical protein